MSVNLEGGGTYPRTDFTNDEISYFGQLSLDYFFPTTSRVIWGLKGYSYYGELKGSGKYWNRTSLPAIPAYYTNIAALGGGVSFTYSISDISFPYAFVGGDYLYYNPKDANGNKLRRNKANKYGYITWSIVGEIGSRFFISNSVSLNVALNYHYTPTDNMDDVDNAISNGTQSDVFFSGRIGFSYYFCGINDSDNDGVRDEDDFCPDTPLNVQVDEFGCPIDSDNDGVPDYLDKCPDTPKHVIVDKNGCPLDLDNDGVPDYLDLCPDTPVGIKVDDSGCPSDSDGDGVPDNIDRCPNTPKGVEVDKWGCPVNEGLAEPIAPEKTEIILSSDVSFEINKADLLPSAYPELDKTLQIMKEHPITKWKIEGHTDNTGTYSRNMELSLQRAQSVFNYFTNNGIPPARLSVYGYGPDYPIADNITEHGKAMNRRVMISLLTSDDIDKMDKEKKLIENSGIYNSTIERNTGDMIYTDGNLYCFQVSSWQTIEKAESEMKKLQSKGYNSFIVKAVLPGKDEIRYRVRIGYFKSLDELNKIKNTIR